MLVGHNCSKMNASKKICSQRLWGFFFEIRNEPPNSPKDLGQIKFFFLFSSFFKIWVFFRGLSFFTGRRAVCLWGGVVKREDQFLHMPRRGPEKNGDL